MTNGSNNTYVYAVDETSGIYRLHPGASPWEDWHRGLYERTIVCGQIVDTH